MVINKKSNLNQLYKWRSPNQRVLVALRSDKMVCGIKNHRHLKDNIGKLC